MVGKTSIFAWLVGLGTSLGAAQAADLKGPLVTAKFFEGKIRWDGTLGLGYTYRADVFEIGGQLVLCGSGAYGNAQVRMATRDILKKSELIVNGKTVLRDLRFFTKVARPKKILGSVSTCRATSIKTLPKNADIILNYGGGVYRF